MASSQPRIAIIGGGPAGLTLGLLLHKQNVPFTIFELRQKPTDEELAKPSGMLDLHEESGIAAITECGLYDDFLQLTGECSEDQKIANKEGEILYKDEGGERDRPEISRHALTKLLISSVPANQIKWGYKLLSASSTTTAGSTEITLDFGPNGQHKFDFVVGADGAWSKIRNLLTDTKPHYANQHIITLTIRNITTKYPHLAELVGKGSFSALATHHGVMSQRGPQDSSRIYIFLTTEDEHFATTSGLANQPPTAMKDQVLTDPALLGTWGPLMKELVSTASDEEATDNPNIPMDIRPLFMLPIGHSWTHKPAATVIGDAAHLMTPFAGEGVNLAMWDSLLLARAITKATESTVRDSSASFQSVLDPLIAEFEADMVERAKEKAQETVDNAEMLFGEDGAKAFVDFFESMGMGMGQPPIIQE